ncbi:MAG: CDP-alcohol phosphatidyltransferase [Bacteroidetes bacterium 46-16]|nr:MAG: CDP-alcohol phosphatidyltransferase [Bacteroidetes bacterium 46-16]
MNWKDIRNGLQQGIYKVINPFVRFLIKLGLTPNAVTTIGLILNIGVAVIFIIGAEEGNRGDLSYVGWAGALVLFAGIFDMLDGQVARLGKMSSTFGAMYDSVLDRYSEMVMFLGICYYLVAHHYFFSSLFAFIALIGSMMVSYTRARAEGLGIECKGGLMQRPERVVLVGLSAIACGVAAHFIGGDYKLFVPGISFHVFETMSIFTMPITVMAILANITAIRRLKDAKKALDQKDRRENIHRNAAIIIMLIIACAGIFAPAGNIYARYTVNVPAVGSEVDTFPVPNGIKNMMFYVQRTPNTNTIVYELNYNKEGTIDEETPIHIFWLRYQEDGSRKELNFIQRKFAYGLNVKKLNANDYELRFVSYNKHPMYLRKATDGKYYVFTEIAHTLAVLKRIYLRIEGGSFWVPNVVYIELKGTDAATGKEIIERLKP